MSPTETGRNSTQHGCHVYTSHACQLGDRLAVIDRSVAADTPGQVGQRPIELQAEVCCAVAATVQN